jgi:DDE family transposase
VAAVTLQTRVICAAAGVGRISFGMCPPVSVLLAGQRRGLADHLALVSDPRDVRGVRHTLTSLLLAAVAVVLAGTRSFTATGEWVADGPPQVVASLEYAVIR